MITDIQMKMLCRLMTGKIKYLYLDKQLKHLKQLIFNR